MTMHVSSLPVWLGVGGPSTISVSPASSSVSEGSSLTFNVFAVYPDNTILYFNLNTSASTATAADFTTYSGSFLITNKAGSFTVTLATDSGAETETFCMNVLTGSITGTVVGTSSSVSITDTSPIYSVTPRASSVNEGGSLIFDVSTINVSNGTVVYYNLSSSSTATSADFTSYSGSVTITSGAGTFTVTVVNDLVSETEYFYMDIKTGSISGTIVATSAQVIINNVTPIYSVTPRASSVNEGNSLVFDVSTTYVPDATVLYYNLSSSSTATTADFTSYSGSLTITSGASTFSVTIAGDLVSDSEYFYMDLKTGSVSGTVVATSSQVTITNIPPTVSPRSFTVSEGSSLVFDVVAYATDGTVLYYNLNSSSTATTADFTSYSGSCTITSNASTFSVTLATDTPIESEYFYIDLKTDSITGTIIATSSQVTISDTSPTFAFSNFPSSVPQGGITYFDVTGTNVPNNTTVYYRLSTTTLDYTATSSDFTRITGSFLMTSNAGSSIINPILGWSSNSGKTFRLELYLTDGTILATSSICTIATASATIQLMDPANTSVVATSNKSLQTYNYPTPVGVTYRITTTNVASGATIYWGISNQTTKVAECICVESTTSNKAYGSYSNPANGISNRTVYVYGAYPNSNWWCSTEQDQMGMQVNASDYGLSSNPTGVATATYLMGFGNPKQLYLAYGDNVLTTAIVRLPWNISSYSAVAIGGGGGGGMYPSAGSNYGAGGGGGGLAYKISVSVTTQYHPVSVILGVGGAPQNSSTAAQAGTGTAFSSANTLQVTATGGKAASGITPGGVSVVPGNGDANFTGGAGSYTAHTTATTNGGGAGTYTANGGTGTGIGTWLNGTPAVGDIQTPLYGAGGSGTLYVSGGQPAGVGYGGNGGFRIMWGTNRSYPATNAKDQWGTLPW